MMIREKMEMKVNFGSFESENRSEEGNRNHRNKIPFLLLLVCIILYLSGCVQNKVAIQTNLVVEKDGSGSRQMELTIEKDAFETLFGSNLGKITETIQQNCPKDVEWSVSEEEKQYEFRCTLQFNSLKDYKKKAKVMAERSVSIEIEQPESVFASGLRYEENFNSIELFAWLKSLLVEEGYLDERTSLTDLFEEKAVQFEWQGTAYEVKMGSVKVDTLLKTPVERIDFLTHYMQNKTCSRQVVFSFSQNSMKKNGEAIKAYLKKNTPKGAESSWTEKNGESFCTISAENLTFQELNAFMVKLFGESDTFVSAQTKRKAGLFDAAAQWSELLNTEAFSYEKEKVAVGYYIQWDDGMNITVRKQNEDLPLRLEDSERYGGYQIVLEDKVLSESLVTEISTTYVISEIAVTANFDKNEELSREIVLVFQVKPDLEDLERILKVFQKAAKGIAEVTVDEAWQEKQFAIVISQQGSILKLNEGFLKLFQVQGQLSHEVQGDLLEWKHAGQFADVLDFTNFIGNEPALTTLTYSLVLPSGEDILTDSVSSNVKLTQGNQEVKGNTYRCSVEGAYLSLTCDTEVWNKDSVQLFLLLFGVVLLILSVTFLVVGLRKRIAALAGQQDDREEEDWEGFDEFEKDENPKRFKGFKNGNSSRKKETAKKFPRFWKKPPFVKYEEACFIDKEDKLDDLEKNLDDDLEGNLDDMEGNPDADWKDMEGNFDVDWKNMERNPDVEWEDRKGNSDADGGELEDNLEDDREKGWNPDCMVEQIKEVSLKKDDFEK